MKKKYKYAVIFGAAAVAVALRNGRDYGGGYRHFISGKRYDLPRDGV